MEEYKVLAEIYDILNPKDEVYIQKPFFEELAQTYSIQSVLDCACGTGIHLSLFHEMGLKAFGSDISEDMLKVASSNLQGTNILLKKEDFRSLENSWHDSYDLVACLTTSLPYMRSDEDLKLALQSMYDRLRDGGILVITRGITDSLLDAQPKFIPARINQNDAFYFVCDYTQESMTFNILYVKHGAEVMEHVFTSTTYNAMRKSVIEPVIKSIPFSQISYFGDYDFSDYSPESSRNLIIVAQK